MMTLCQGLCKQHARKTQTLGVKRTSNERIIGEEKEACERYQKHVTNSQSKRHTRGKTHVEKTDKHVRDQSDA